MGMMKLCLRFFVHACLDMLKISVISDPLLADHWHQITFDVLHLSFWVNDIACGKTTSKTETSDQEDWVGMCKSRGHSSSSIFVVLDLERIRMWVGLIWNSDMLFPYVALSGQTWNGVFFWMDHIERTLWEHKCHCHLVFRELIPLFFSGVLHAFLGDFKRCRILQWSQYKSTWKSSLFYDFETLTSMECKLQRLSLGPWKCCSYVWWW